MDSTGVAILVAISLLSLFAIFGLLLAFAVSAFNTRHSNDPTLFVRSHVFAYFGCLLICWIFQCIASTLSISWLQDSQVVFGPTCTAQGMLKHVADVGVAIWTTVLAGQTFCVLFLEFKTRRSVLLITLFLGWASIFSLVAPGSLSIAKKGSSPFYDIDGLWCWISPEYGLSRKLLAQMIMFLAAPLSAILYILTFLRMRGNIVRDGWKLSFRRMGEGSSKYFARSDARMVAKQMLLYPITYALLVTPMAIVEFVRWSGVKVPFEWVIFSGSVYMLSGLVNVILFSTTRRLLPASTLRIGSWYLINPTPNSQDRFVAQGIYAADVAEKGKSKTVTFAAEPTILCTPPAGRRNTRRPTPLDLPEVNRDSLASMYSVREGFHPPPPMSSHWSADTPPLYKISRLSIAIGNVSSIARRI